MINQQSKSGSSMKNTPKSQIKRNRNRPRKRGPNQARNCPKDIVKECTRNYLRVQVDPWAHFNTGKEVCIPDDTSRPSWKIQTFRRFTMHCNAFGVGVVGVNPFSAMYNNTDSMSHTMATSTGASLQALSSVLEQNIRAPFASTALVHSRSVGCGIRIKYIGKYLDTSGIMGVGIRQNAAEDLGPLTPAEFLSRPSTCRTAVTHGGKWTQLAYRPAENSDIVADSHTEPVSSKLVMAAVVEGAQPGAPFEVEVCCFFEYYSTPGYTLPGTTVSHSDNPGIGAVREFVNKVWNAPITADLYNRGMDYIYKYLSNTAMSIMRSAPLLLTA